MEEKLVTRNTAAWRLWHLPFHVRVPSLSQYSTDYLRKNPINVSGDRSLDRIRMNEMINVRHTCAAIAMLTSEGYPVELINRWDCVQMYTDIQEHFRNWLDQTYGGYPPEAFPPIDDFRLLEIVALEMHAEAQRMSPKDREIASRIMDGIERMNRRRNLVGATKAALARQSVNGQVKAYNSMVDQIEKYILG